jgi:DNA-binding transcriptional LysR family regulator
VHDDPLVLVAAVGHRLSLRQTISLADLQYERFFVHVRFTTMRASVQRLFADHDVPFKVAAELWNFETIKQFVRTGGGIAFVPASVARADLEAHRLVTISVGDLNIARPIEVVYRQKEKLEPAPAALLAFLRRWRWNPVSHRAPEPPVIGDPAKPAERPPWAHQSIRVGEMNGASRRGA